MFLPRVVLFSGLGQHFHDLDHSFSLKTVSIFVNTRTKSHESVKLPEAGSASGQDEANPVF